MQFSNGFKRYFKNTSWLLFERVLRSTILLFVGIYVARYLGPSRYGLLSYAMSFVHIFSFIATFGLDNIVVRDLVNEEKKRDKLLGSAFVIKGLGAILLLGVLAVAVRFTSNDGFTNILIFIIASSMIFQSFSVVDFYFRSRVLSKYSVYARAISAVFSSIVKLSLIYFKAELVYFAATMAIESAILAVAFIVVYRKQKLSILDWRIGFDLAKRLSKDSWPLMLSGAAVSIYMRIDQVMIKSIIDSEAVGNYAVSVKLSEAWYFIPTAITGSVLPAIVNARKVSEELYFKRLQRLYSLMIWTAVAIALPTTFWAKDVIRLIYGLQYQGAAEVLRIYIWAGIFVSLGAASSQYLISQNYTRISLLRTFIGMIANVTLNIILIPRYGITGAAAATLASYFLATFFIVFIPKTSKQVTLMLKSVNLLGIVISSIKRT